MNRRQFFSTAAAASAVLSTPRSLRAAAAPARIPIGFLGATYSHGPAKIELVTKAAGTVAPKGLQPDLNRPKEPLEAFPLESMRMVGVIQQPKMNFGLVKADASVYRVKIGNYMGQNFGIITDIKENQILLRELVQDAGGDWAERQSTLQLVESGGGGR